MISLRPITPEDADMIFEWRNDPFVYRHSNTPRAVTKQEHGIWFLKQLKSVVGAAFIIIHHAERHTPIGLVRYELNKNLSSVCVSIFMPEKFTGQGLGTQAIRECCREIRERWPAAKIAADIKPENRGSIRAFCKAGFVMSCDDVMVYR